MPWALPTRTLKFYEWSFHDDATLKSRTTLEVYSQARTRAKQEAQQRLVELIMPDDTQIMMKRRGPDESLDVTYDAKMTCGQNGSFWIDGKGSGSQKFVILLNRSGRHVGS